MSITQRPKEQKSILTMYSPCTVRV